MKAQDLSEDLIARAFTATVPDDPVAMPLRSQEEIDASRKAVLGGLSDDADLWLFGYGSLMWKPDFDFAERLHGQVWGWSRAFCLWTWRWRGSRAAPGMMMGLDRGGSCAGVLFRVTGPDASDKLAPVWRREMIGRAYRPVWVNVGTTAGQHRAICFVADRTSERYAGRLAETEIARHIAKACGSVGPNATYLLETWRHCETMGISDSMLRRLQKLVARELICSESR